MIYASFFQRFLAFLIDAVILIVAGAVLNMALPGSSSGLLGQITSILLGVAYFAGLESSQRQATFGKSALGLKVTDLNGNRIGFGRAVGRYLGKYLSAFILLIGYLMALFTKKRQALHDLIAGTVVMGPEAKRGAGGAWSRDWDHRDTDMSLDSSHD